MDVSEILKLSGDFLDDIIEELRDGAKHLRVYIVEHNKNVVGITIIIPKKAWKAQEHIRKLD